MTLRLTKEIGRQGYLEIVDRSVGGHIVVDRIVFSDSPTPPLTPPRRSQEIQTLASQAGIQSLEALAVAYRTLAMNVLKNRDTGGVVATLSPTGSLEDLAASDLPAASSNSMQQSEKAPPSARALGWLRLDGAPRSASPASLALLSRLQAERTQAERQIPESV